MEVVVYFCDGKSDISKYIIRTRYIARVCFENFEIID